jgi:hypothetical protein
VQHRSEERSRNKLTVARTARRLCLSPSNRENNKIS